MLDSQLKDTSSPPLLTCHGLLGLNFKANTHPNGEHVRVLIKPSLRPTVFPDKARMVHIWET